MADNIILNEGTGGATLMTDEVGSAHAQIVKPAFGGDGVATIVSASDPLPVTMASVPSHAVTNAGTFAVQAAQSGTWTIQPGNTANTTAWLVTGTGGTFPVTDAGGSLTVDDGGTTLSVDDGGGAITVDNGGTFAVQAARTLSTGDNALTSFTLISAASNNATSVATGARRLHWFAAYNTSASLKYLKFYDKASAPNPSSDTPILTIPIPPLGGYSAPLPAPLGFALGLAYAVVAGIATNDNTAVAASDVVVNGGYV